MTKEQLDKLHELPNKDKFEAVQLLWNDLTLDSDIDTLPLRHKTILQERISLIDAGTTKFKNWDKIKEKYSPKAK